MYYIGVDLGTSSVKLLLMDKQGTVVKTVSKEYPISFPKPGCKRKEDRRIQKRTERTAGWL